MELNIRIAGEAGQGLQTAGDLLGRAVTRVGLFAYGYNDAESRIRGGLNFNHMRISNERLMGVTNRIDILLAFTERALDEFGGDVNETGFVITSGEWEHSHRAPFTLASIAKDAGSVKAQSTVAFAVLSALMGLNKDIVDSLVKETFGSNEDLLAFNIKAGSLGYDAAEKFQYAGNFRMPDGDSGKGRLWISGGEAIAMGAVAGGVSFIAAYPMSPSTSIMTNLAQWLHETGVVVEQAEDEIAAINMLAGASYAGARAMTATSGGGFALMVEGLSNIGMIEVPAVIVLAQRPGPATGLPTRTAQGDLNFARHAGHGHFARILIAPRNVPECFEIAARAFDTAEKYQVPVIILTDQLLQDSYATVDPFGTAGFPTTRHYLTSDQLASMDGYRRYEQVESGISPIAAPGTSKHVVVADSDEHDEDGHMIEAAEIALRMAAKRLRKIETVRNDMGYIPEVEGGGDNSPLIVSWGSSYETLAEARRLMHADGKIYAHLHLQTLWPIPEETLQEIIGKAPSLIVVESSAGCELAGLLRETGLRKPRACISKLDGRPFAVEELVEKLGEVIQ